jgi:hypothetical protein
MSCLEYRKKDPDSSTYRSCPDVPVFRLFGNGGWQGDGIPPYTIVEGVVRGEVYIDGGHGYTGENLISSILSSLPEGKVCQALCACLEL